MKRFYKSMKLVTIVILSITCFTTLLTHLNQTAQAAPAAELDVCVTCTYTTIQTAVSAANSGDTIRVAQGTYTGMMSTSGLTATVVLTKDLVLLGGFNADFSQRDPDNYVTTIDTESNLWGGVFIFGSQSEVDGFHIVNAYGGGVAVVNDESVTAVGTVTHNYIAHNRIMTGTQLSEGGAGVNIADGAEATIAHNEIVSNTIERAGSYGGGIILIDSIAEIYGNQIAYNLTHPESVGGGIDVFRATAVIRENNIHHNAINGIGIYRSTAEVLSNTIDSNTAYGGGGMEISSESIFTVTNNIISNNIAQLYSGGGIAIYDGATGIISSNEIMGNKTDADTGGGIGTYRNGDLTIVNNTIRNNYATTGGGGMDINPDDAAFTTTTQLTITTNIIESNQGGYGTAIAINNVNGDILVAANDIRKNEMVTGTPDFQSGGIHIWGSHGDIQVMNNLLVQNANRGLKVADFSHLDVINNTFADNGSTGIETFAWPITPTEPFTTTAVNNIIVGHTECAITGFNGVTMYVDYNLFYNNNTDICGPTAAPPHANIFADPLFVNAAGGNYRLQPGSPAVNSGFAGPGAPDVDIEGTSRPQGSGVDMGAYEAVFHQLFLPAIVKPVEITNVALGKAVQITTNGANDPYIGSGLSPADVTDGSLEYKAVSFSQEDGVIGFVNHDYAEEMEVVVTIDLGGTYDITSIRYNPGNVQFANYWRPDLMITPFQTTATVPGTTYNGAWTEHNGTATISSVTVTFKTTRDSYYEDWFFIGEIEVYGIPAS